MQIEQVNAILDKMRLWTIFLLIVIDMVLFLMQNGLGFRNMKP